MIRDEESKSRQLDKIKGISRIDSQDGRTHGWYVRVFFKSEKRIKFFSDGVYGGKERAFEKALRFRNRAERELGKPRTDRIIITQTKRNQTTGIVGIRKKKERDVNKDGEIVYRNIYEVSWCPEPNRVINKRISIDKYGEEQAFHKAYRIKRAAEKQLYGKPILPPLKKWLEQQQGQ
ncbi:MAG: hypothetical protein JNN15_15250 [Blastocatellia bacterium]|nr:hypothetical protein [Blastocatellia bacterium]